MSLRNAVMAALLDGESSGYDLAKAFDASVANFWICTPQQLYRELDRMEADGLIVARTVEQERRPNKRLFSLTELGREELTSFTAGPHKPTAIRDELLVAVLAADSGDTEGVLASVRERKQWAEAKVARYERLRAKLLDGRSEEDFLATAERVGPYLTLLRGLSFERDNVRWCARSLTVLERRGARLDAPG
ncbi:PadR family transcriptional regulator [Lentzea flaviverrucosa]|uniref:DNA-binding transcriptional regulator, PadR family n=1 Tax=Lentzea flaviverrucosa TaxID=200379 RepID=A0A1H9JNX1_9PSEU|nr:PadR family transcriptional regulator [Lentzea flaviverrucosa]RDI26580.1 PadR family transcriptional regulator [Lentzea flaviverrucosa]SEQ88443.1 DNA-binding transcriptional regulator, PadR family [Lentzea flaviverrucosa]